MDFGGLPLKGSMVVQPQKGAFFLPKFNKHSLKISRESLPNYYLLAFTQHFKYSPKKRHFIFATFYFFTRKLSTILKN